jgi:hypothetical protein
MKYSELTRKLSRLGCQIWRNPATGKQAPMPYHRTKDIGPNLLARILRALEIERLDFDQA